MKTTQPNTKTAQRPPPPRYNGNRRKPATFPPENTTPPLPTPKPHPYTNTEPIARPRPVPPTPNARETKIPAV